MIRPNCSNVIQCNNHFPRLGCSSFLVGQIYIHCMSVFPCGFCNNIIMVGRFISFVLIYLSNPSIDGRYIQCNIFIKCRPGRKSDITLVGQFYIIFDSATRTLWCSLEPVGTAHCSPAQLYRHSVAFYQTVRTKYSIFVRWNV